ncbi:hypothetical protein [Flavobacterium terrigena]|uniref:YhhN-like protein n=1 Tax=Flavobacterium terrigena TaxID=402734 RepID=A0A1H6R0H0_9FLAO|nr:hypothetical protein [Flavobacterium terrigena]SEI46734.1 hypothetical protein SAMN05660918_0734 [Flavobacterium terrigena]
MKVKYYFYILTFAVAILYLIGFKNKSKTYKIFSLFLIADVVLNFISDELYNWFGIYNHFFINIIFLFQFGFLSLFYSYSFDNKKWRNIVEVLLIIVSSYLIIKYSIFPDTFFILHYQDVYLTIFPIIVYGVVYLYNEYDKPQELYYANLGILIHFIVNFFCFISWPLQSLSIEYDYLDEFNIIISNYSRDLHFITYIIYAIVLLYQLKKLKSK